MAALFSPKAVLCDPMLPSSPRGPVVISPARNAAFLGYHIMRVPAPLAPMVPAPNVPAATRPLPLAKSKAPAVVLNASVRLPVVPPPARPVPAVMPVMPPPELAAAHPTEPLWPMLCMKSPAVQLPLTRSCTCAGSIPVAPIVTVGAAVGRGPPPVLAPGVKTNAPECPALSRQVPLVAGRLTVASTCPGAPPGALTMFNPKPMLPLAFGKAVPITEADSPPAPH